MNQLLIQSTNITVPYINLNPSEGEFRIEGQAMPDNPAEVFKPVLDFFNLYKLQPHVTNNLHIGLKYCNSHSAKCIFEIVKIFVEMKEQGHEVNINWYYADDDDDMLEMGKDYEVIFDIPINFKLIPKISN